MRYENKILIIASFILFCCHSDEKLILAKVDREEILLSDFQNKYESFLSQKYQNDNLSNRYAYLNNLIDEKLILKYAYDQKLDKDTSYTKKAKIIFNQLLLNEYFDKKINLDFSTNEDELKNVFMWEKKALNIRHLFSRDKQGIDKIYSNLKNGKSWELLAKECFNDTLLKQNGGDLGWYNIGELDPVFEWNAYQLKLGEISKPVRTKDGYSIIQIVDVELNGLLLEDEYQSKRKKVKNRLKNYKQQLSLLNFTDSTILELDIKFDSTELENIYNFLLPLSNLELENIKYNTLVYFDNENWNVSKALNQLSSLSSKQLSRINDVFDLKQVIIGLVCRNIHIDNAIKDDFHKTKSFKYNLRQNLDQTMIKKVVADINKRVKNKNDQYHEKIIENYFNFRKELMLASIIEIDSTLIKNFIM